MPSADSRHSESWVSSWQSLGWNTPRNPLCIRANPRTSWPRCSRCTSGHLLNLDKDRSTLGHVCTLEREPVNLAIVIPDSSLGESVFHCFDEVGQVALSFVWRKYGDMVGHSFFPERLDLSPID